MSINIESVRLFLLCAVSAVPTISQAQIPGEYDVIQFTPRGEKNSVLRIDEEGKGALITERGTSEITDLKSDGENFEFNTLVPTPFGKTKSRWTGEVEGDELKATIKTKMGNFQATGTRK